MITVEKDRHAFIYTRVLVIGVSHFNIFLVNFLEDNVQMIYLDQRGCGRSEHSATQDYSLKRILGDIEE